MNVQTPLQCDGARYQRLPLVAIYHCCQIGQGLHTLVALHLMDTEINNMTILQITSVDQVQCKLAGLPGRFSGGLLQEVVHHLLQKAEPDSLELVSTKRKSWLASSIHLFPITLWSKTLMSITSAGGGAIQVSKY